MKVVARGVRDGMPIVAEAEIDDAEIERRRAAAEQRRAVRVAAAKPTEPVKA